MLLYFSPEDSVAEFFVQISASGRQEPWCGWDSAGVAPFVSLRQRNELNLTKMLLT